MIQFSFESPLDLLGDSLNYNDYEYCLVHLLDKYPSYNNFYREQIKHRTMYLDNGAYELGESFDPIEFKKIVKSFADISLAAMVNLWYFLPDYPGDPVKTLKAAKDFGDVEAHGFRVKKIGVVHGDNFKTSLASAHELAQMVDMLAIPMLPDNYDGKYQGLDGRSKARAQLIRDINNLMESGVIKERPIHILGCLLPQEVSKYVDFPKVKSMDTSNPVLHGMLGQRYGLRGLDEKSSVKMEELMEKRVTPELFGHVLANIERFWEFANKENPGCFQHWIKL